MNTTSRDQHPVTVDVLAGSSDPSVELGRLVDRLVRAGAENGLASAAQEGPRAGE
jgi:hypothetical protein